MSARRISILLLALLLPALASADTKFSQFSATTYNPATDNAVGWRSGAPNSNIYFPLTGLTESVVSISSNTVATCTPYTWYVYLITGTTTLTIPTAVGSTCVYTAKNVSGASTVNFTAGQTGDGSATLPLTVVNTSLTLVSDTANWKVI